MQFNQKDLFDSGEFEYPLNYKLDVDASHDRNSPVGLVAVQVGGVLKSKAGVVTLDYTLSCDMNTQCGRCLDNITPTFTVSGFHTIVEKLDAQDTLSDEYIETLGEGLDLNELFYSEVLLGMPAVFICRDECKGLCPRCGVNKNDASCSCASGEVDPRLEKLRGLLER